MDRGARFLRDPSRDVLSRDRTARPMKRALHHRAKRTLERLLRFGSLEDAHRARDCFLVASPTGCASDRRR